MEAALSSEATAVVSTFVGAYVSYVETMIRDQGLPAPSALRASLDDGRSWLDETLSDLLAQPLDAQRRSPLEVFQEAMRYPTGALQREGVPPVARDEATQHALPGDVYGLAPASSQDLGEAAWRAHLAWGVAKAKAVGGAVAQSESRTTSDSGRRPVVALVGTDLMDRSRIEPVVQSGGLTLEVWRNPAAIVNGLAGQRPVLALIDLTHSAADEAIRSVTDAGVRCIAFGPHVDDVALTRAESLGATDALARSRFFKRLPELLPRQA